MKKPLIRGAALAAILCSSLTSLAHADDKPRLYLSWHAPYGALGAKDTLSVRPGDGGRDTLFLSFETGADWPTFCGLGGQLYFRAPAGAALASHWLDEMNVEFQFATDSIPGYSRMWRGTQSMRYSYWSTERGSGLLRFGNARPTTYPLKARDHLPYLCARVMVDHPPADAAEATQPICVEWAQAEFFTDTTGVSALKSGRTGHPFASMNSPSGAVCEPFMPTDMVKATKPADEPKKPAKPKGKRAGK